MIRRISTLCLLIFGLLACKNDPPSLVTADMNEQERNYFEDYESPESKWGYINKNGAMVIKNIYDDCRDFIDGVAIVNLKGKWGYIDTNGELLIDHKYMEAGSFKSGLALVKDFEGRTYFINKEGKEILSFEADKIKEFEHGLSLCMKGNLWGAYDTNGKEIISAKYMRLKVLNENHLVAKLTSKSILLDHNGEKVNDVEFDKLYFDGSYPYVIRTDKQYFVLDERHQIINNSYDKIEAFKSELSLAKNDGQYQLIDIRGKQVKKLNYNKVEYAGQGHWKYKENDKWGLLDKQGEEMTEADFYLLNRYKEDFIVYGENEDNWGYLDSKGDVATKAEYPLVWDYHNGHARIISRTGFGFIDKTSNISVDPKYFELRDFNDGLARAQLFW